MFYGMDKYEIKKKRKKIRKKKKLQKMCEK